MPDEVTTRTEAIHRAAECRERAAKYEALAQEAKERGDIEMSSQFASNAVAERQEAQRLEQHWGR